MFGKIKTICLLAVLLSASNLSAGSVFSGFAGAKIGFSSDKEADGFDPDLMVQSFFSGQFSFSENIIAHTEFSLRTSDLIANSIFKKTPAEFQLDEVSLIFRKQFSGVTNYFSIFLGTYEPIGSDIFLRRQFGIQPIASRITESWLGLAGSVIYPLFGVGGADVVRFSAQPIAVGLYAYVNHELDDSYVLNADGRFACAYRLFAFDFSAGVGTPLRSSAAEDAFVVIDKIYWRAGMNMLIGNHYTTSVFLQAGVSDVPFAKRGESFEIDEERMYLLLEPRILAEKFQLHISFFSLPQDTVDELIFVEDTLGVNLNVFTDNLYIGSRMFLFGVNAGLSFPEKHFMDFRKPKELFDEYTVLAAPYFGSQIGNGQFRVMLQARISDFIVGHPASAFSLNVGYKSQF